MIVVVGYDIEAPNPKLLDVAIEVAAAFKAEVHVTSCLPGSKVTRCSWEEKADAGFARVQKAFEKRGVRFNLVKLFTGKEAGERIVDYAAEHHASFIVMGVYTKSKLQKFVFGSNTQVAVLTAKCPVITVNVN